MISAVQHVQDKPFAMIETLFIGLFLISAASAFVLEGSQTSYAQFQKWYPNPHNAKIQFEFQTDQPEGVLLYMDDGGYYDFMELKLVKGAVRLRYNLGRGAQVLTVGKGLNDGNRWHLVVVTRNGNATSLAVDGNSRMGVSHPADIRFGNYSSNSYVYVGGLPSWYTTKLSMLALPSVVFEPRFQGAIRNLVYADDQSGQPKRQEVMAYKGVRASTVDACEHQNPCKNGGICISTDGGPICECRYIDFEGVFCERGKEAPEATFTGDEYLSYDLTKLGGEPIVSTQDDFSLYFRTNRPDGLLFHTGDSEDFLTLSVKDGGVELTIGLGSGTISTSIKPPYTRFDDDTWHHVRISRVLQQQSHSRYNCHVSFAVDDYTERPNTSGASSMLSSSRVFIAGAPRPFKIQGTNAKNNFVGCLKKVEFKADSLHLPLLELAKDGNRLMNVVGDVAFKCNPIEPILPVAFTSGDSYMANIYMMQHGGVVSFTRPDAFLVLPNWNNSNGGSFAFKFRTNEKNGLLFFSIGTNIGQGDFFALELLSGYLYLHLDLGTGAVRMRASNRVLDDGAWHKVELIRTLRAGTITVDEESNDFETPGEALKLELEGPLYVGGVDPSLETIRVPPVLWSATLKHGFVGCLRDLVVNGVTIDVAEFAQKQNSGSIRSSCHILPPKCNSDRPCMHGGRCIDGWNRYICDCTATSFTGPTCGQASTSVRFDGRQHMKIPIAGVSEAEDVRFRFRTTERDGFLLATCDEGSSDRLEFVLKQGSVKMSIKMGLTRKSLTLGRGLDDDLWHTVKFQRREMLITFAVDDDKPIIEEAYGSESFLDYTSLHVGGAHPLDDHSEEKTIPPFSGYIQQLHFNGQELIERVRNGIIADYEFTGSFGPRDHIVFNSVTFKSQQTHLSLPQMKAYYDISIEFLFRTREPNGLLLYSAGKEPDFLAIELVNGHIHYVLNLGYGPISIKDNSPITLNDNKWHSVSIGRPAKYRHTLLVDDHLATANSRGEQINLDLDGILFLGGVRASMYGKLPPQIISKFGFQGCLASMELGGETYDPVNQALAPSSLVVSGCDESIAYEWGLKPGLIRFTYPYGKRPDTKTDLMSFGFITPLDSAVIARVDSGEQDDYLELEVIDGHIFANYNLGTQDITLGEVNVKVNDGKYHVVRFTRSGANSTLQVDDYQIKMKYPTGRQLTVFNTQSQIQLGGKWNPTLSRVERPFRGVLAGLVYNGLRPLDMAADRDTRTKVQGDVRILDSIPFDYRHKNKQLFHDKNIQKTNPSGYLPEPGIDDDLVFGSVRCDDDEEKYYDPNCFSYDGSGDELITPVYLPPTRPPVVRTTPPNSGQPCDDEEDCGFGSGSSAAGSDEYTFNPINSDSTTSTNWPLRPDEDYDWISAVPEQEEDEEVPPVPNPTMRTNQEYERAYDQKYNVYDQPFEPKEDPDSPPDDFARSSSPAGTTILVIGIIAGAIVAIVLIIIIVLRMRTRTEGAYKVDESRTTYQCQPDDEFEAPPSAALIGPGVAAGPDPQGFYAKNLKKNGAKSVKEWYV